MYTVYLGLDDSINSSSKEIKRENTDTDSDILVDVVMGRSKSSLLKASIYSVV